jgi:flagellar hook-associated protein 3 FlgL
MNRISTFTSNQNILTQITRAQQDMYKAQNEVASGKKATSLKEHGRNSETVAATLNMRDRYQSYSDTARILSSQLSTQNLALSEVSAGADDFMQTIREAIGNGTGIGFMDKVSAAYEKVVGALNISYSGQYIFSGGRTDVPPVTATSLDQLATLGSAAAAFQDGTYRASTKLDDTVTVQHGLLAQEDIAEDLFAVFKTIKAFGDANGGLTGNLTPAQSDALSAQIAGLNTVIDGIRNVTAVSSQTEARVDAINQRHGERITTISILLSDMTDADMAEAASRLQLSQTAIQGAAQVFNTLRQSSLLNFLS